MANSKAITFGVSRAPHRSLLKALGFVDEELGRPIIGIANSFNELFLVTYTLKTWSNQ